MENEEHVDTNRNSMCLLHAGAVHSEYGDGYQRRL